MNIKRTLHFVFKIGDRTKTIKFYRDILGMKVLRHEEFEEGCKATCNGPYDGKWSKTMIGYGPEDNNFVCELTYNYGVGKYAMGNDFLGLHLSSSKAVEACKSSDYKYQTAADGSLQVCDPDGYTFFLSGSASKDASTASKVTLASSNLQKSVDYWKKIAGMKVFSESDKQAVLGYNDDQAKLELQDIGKPVEHAKAFGRVAIACPRTQLPGIQESVKATGNKVLTELVSLDTPGKATVEVVIVADPDLHEICFVGDEAFRELSQVDPKGDQLLDDAMVADKSSEWFAKKNRVKAEA